MPNGLRGFIVGISKVLSMGYKIRDLPDKFVFKDGVVDRLVDIVLQTRPCEMDWVRKGLVGHRCAFEIM